MLRLKTMSTNDIRRLIERYKAAIAASNKDESCHESRRELESLRWEEQLPLVYRLRARALLTGDFIIGCWRESEEEEHRRLAADQAAYTEIGAVIVSGSTIGWKETEDHRPAADQAYAEISAVDSGSASSLDAEDRESGVRQQVEKDAERCDGACCVHSLDCSQCDVVVS